jgi:hypothetical protein
MNKIYILFSILFLYTACSTSNAKRVVGKWVGVSLKNPALDKSVADEMMDIDTFGNNDADFKATINLDSFKYLRREALKLDIADQQAALQQTYYEFTAQNNVYLTNPELTDSATYLVENDGTIIIDHHDEYEIQYFYIKQINDSKMILQMVIDKDTSEMEMKKVK